MSVHEALTGGVQRPFPCILFTMYREQEFHFVYEQGVLRPEERLDLPEGARGVARIREESNDRGTLNRTRALDAIRRIGDSGAFNSSGTKLTRDEMHERG